MSARRRRVPIAPAAILALCLLVQLLAAPGRGAARAGCPDVSPPPLRFARPRFIDKTRPGGEPVSVVAQDGSILVSAHAGTTHLSKEPTGAAGAGDFAGSYYNQTLNWRSDDGGRTWDYVGLLGQPAGPHSPTSTGFSDPDLAVDSAGTIYNVEIDLANVSVYSSPDDGQSWPTANPIAATGDRPWITGAGPGELYLYLNTPKELYKSTDGGLTFSLLAGSPAVDGKLIVDPLNRKRGLIGPLHLGGASLSDDGGKTWTRYPAPLGSSTQFFGTVAVDSKGWVYAANAGGYSGAGDDHPDGSVTFNYFNRSTREWQDRPIRIPTPRGDALWPWIVAGDDGRAAVAWYQTSPDAPDEFYVYVAYTLNAHGSVVTCSDGSRRFVPPQFSVVNASQRPIHRGSICLYGTSCVAESSAEAGDRRLGDFFTINYDAAGNIFVVSGDTTATSPLGGSKPVSNPVFIKQSAGAPLLERPRKARPTRCVFPALVC